MLVSQPYYKVRAMSSRLTAPCWNFDVKLYFSLRLYCLKT